MSPPPAVTARNVGKVYRIWETPAARLTVPMYESVGRLLGDNEIARAIDQRSRSRYRDFHALRDITLEVQRGEAVGIIGRNGSGKSTLLQIIAGTMRPSTGSISLNGRVAALLELGSGFSPEFTGRENVHLNATTLGLSRREIEDRFEQIAAFADIGDFIDQPVKIYSTGMLVRLAFAVQTAVEPEVLIVDEALSVGDEAFQRKCFARLESLRAGGTSLLFVSHDIQTVSRICDRAVLLHQGELAVSGPPGLVGKLYQKLLYSRGADVESIRREHALITSPAPDTGSATAVAVAPNATDRSYHDPELISRSQVSYACDGAEITAPAITTPGGARVNVLEAGREYRFHYKATFSRDARKVVFACAIKTKDGVELSGMHSHAYPDSLERIPGDSRFSVEFSFNCSLNPGTYFFNAGIVTWGETTSTYLHRLVDCVAFRVVQDGPNRSTSMCQLVVDSKVTRLADE